MNYRHSYHAGNFADVFKHIVLTALLQAFLRKDSAFCFFDTHAGIARYDLASLKNAEYTSGITKILAAKNPPLLVQNFLKYLPGPMIYPGSPLIARQMLRPHDRLILSELHPEDYGLLKKFFARDKQVSTHHRDGFESLNALLPPKEKRALILIDPPYERIDDYDRALLAITRALRHFAQGVFALWYPIKDKRSHDLFLQKLKSQIQQPLLIIELSIFPIDVNMQLNGSGMAIINPPWQLESQLQEVVPWLWDTLKVHPASKWCIM